MLRWNYLGSSLREENYRRQFTDALRDCVVDVRHNLSFAKFRLCSMEREAG